MGCLNIYRDPSKEDLGSMLILGNRHNTSYFITQSISQKEALNEVMEKF